MNNELEYLWKTYSTINEWIRFADTKAGGILALNGVIAGIVISKILGSTDCLQNHPGLSILLVIGAITAFGSIYFAVRCLNPTLKVGESSSLIFFAHVAKAFSTPDGYRQAVQKTFTDDGQLMTQISDQVWANSKVAWKKYKNVVWATRFLALTVSVFIFASIVIALLN